MPALEHHDLAPGAGGLARGAPGVGRDRLALDAAQPGHLAGVRGEDQPQPLEGFPPALDCAEPVQPVGVEEDRRLDGRGPLGRCLLGRGAEAEPPLAARLGRDAEEAAEEVARLVLPPEAVADLQGRVAPERLGDDLRGVRPDDAPVGLRQRQVGRLGQVRGDRADDAPRHRQRRQPHPDAQGGLGGQDRRADVVGRPADEQQRAGVALVRVGLAARQAGGRVGAPDQPRGVVRHAGLVEAEGHHLHAPRVAQAGRQVEPLLG